MYLVRARVRVRVRVRARARTRGRVRVRVPNPNPNPNQGLDVPGRLARVGGQPPLERDREPHRAALGVARVTAVGQLFPRVEQRRLRRSWRTVGADVCRGLQAGCMLRSEGCRAGPVHRHRPPTARRAPPARRARAPLVPARWPPSRSKTWRCPHPCQHCRPSPGPAAPSPPAATTPARRTSRRARAAWQPRRHGRWRRLALRRRGLPRPQPRGER